MGVYKLFRTLAMQSISGSRVVYPYVLLGSLHQTIPSTGYQAARPLFWPVNQKLFRKTNYPVRPKTSMAPKSFKLNTGQEIPAVGLGK